MRAELRNFVVFAMLAASTTACGHTPGNSAPVAVDTAPVGLTTSGAEEVRAAGEYLVTLAAGTETRAITDTYGRFGIKGIKELGGGVFLLTLAEDPGAAKMEKLRKQDARIKAVQPNFVYHSNRPGGRVQ